MIIQVMYEDGMPGIITLTGKVLVTEANPGTQNILLDLATGTRYYFWAKDGSFIGLINAGAQEEEQKEG